MLAFCSIKDTIGMAEAMTLYVCISVCLNDVYCAS